MLGRGERNSPYAGTVGPAEVQPMELCVFDQERRASVEPPLALSD